jgi:glycosyltransferase involved in cell wall biosynthesis
LQGEELFLDSLVEPYRSEAMALVRAEVRHVDVFIASSEWYADSMSRRLTIPRDRIRVVPLGINLEGHAPVERQPETFRIGYLARIAPEKGLHVLAEAYRIFRKSVTAPARLEAAGYLPAANREYLQKIQRGLEAQGLAGEFRYHGEVDRAGKIRFLQSLDLFSAPAEYDEPKGMSVLEAMANGVPVVQPRRGVFPEMLERTQGGLLVSPGDPAALAEGLHALWQDAGLRQRFARQAADGAREHHGIARMAGRTLEVYRSVMAVAHA